MKEKHAEIRIQTSFLSAVEKRILVKMAKKLPDWVNSDHLTFIGFTGAVVTAVAYVLSNLDIRFLWLASFGLVINWYGDSLDGTLARVRNTQRPVYGFFIDHNIDAVTISLMCIGAGLSPIVSLSIALLILAGYLVLSIFTYINAHLKGEFKISYGLFGPTEFRLIVIIINTMFIYLPLQRPLLSIAGRMFSLVDVICIAIAGILFTVHFVNIIIYKKEYERIDPSKPYKKNADIQ